MIVRKRPEFSFVMPCNKCEKYIEKAIDSLLDQDFEDWELICVVNGAWDGRDKCIKLIHDYAKKDNRIQLVEIRIGNACTARNVGARISIGKYISFFSSDFYMFPGALRKWKEAFDKNPEADFVYSGYKLMNDGVLVDSYAPSRPFNAKELEIEPYIDGGFPVKREVWEKVEWDIKVKSLNDWDWWIGIARAGFKGDFLPDVAYAAELPKPGGLSADSNKNWLERVRYIKKKHGIKENTIAVFSYGAPPHAKRIAKLLGADCFCLRTPMFEKLKELGVYKAVYLIGFYVGAGDSAHAHAGVFEKTTRDCKKVIHWIGTDILQLIQACHKVCYTDMKLLIDVLDKCKNISEFAQTEGELRSVGINSKILALPIEQNIKGLPLPKKFTVAVYVPTTPTASQIYNLEFVKDVILACPDIKFILFGGGLKDFKPKNVENIGWCDMQKVMAKSSVLMRIAYHDGLPVAPIEFRLAGRDAITTVQMPYVYFAGTGIINDTNYAERKDGIVKLIRTVKSEQAKHGVKDKKKAREHYLKLTDPIEFKKKLMKIIND